MAMAPVSFHRRTGAIVTTLDPKREHPRTTNALVKALFYKSFFRMK
jgi:hypothetical protein